MRSNEAAGCNPQARPPAGRAGAGAGGAGDGGADRLRRAGRSTSAASGSPSASCRGRSTRPRSSPARTSPTPPLHTAKRSTTAAPPATRTRSAATSVTAGSPTVTFECVSHAPNYTAGSPADLPGDRVTRTASRPAPGPAALRSHDLQCGQRQGDGDGEDDLPRSVPSQLQRHRQLHVGCAGRHSAPAQRRGHPRQHPIDDRQLLRHVPGISSNPEKLDCAKAGVRPCSRRSGPAIRPYSCGAATANTGGQLGANVAAPVDEVGMEVIPAISGNPPATTTLDKEVDCNSSSTFTVTYPT